MMHHDGEPNPLKIKNVPGITESKNDWGQFTVPAAHIYKSEKVRFMKLKQWQSWAFLLASNGWNCTRKCLVI